MERTEMSDPPAPAEPPSRSRHFPRRRSPLWLVSWVVLAALACFLIAVAAGLISDKDSSSLAGSAAVTTSQPANSQAAGWTHPATYVGRYRLDVVQSAGSHSPAGSQRVSGSLSLFLRTIKHDEPLALSGILTLTGPSGEQLVYMTNLTSKQGILHADINGGSYFGPVIGSFTGIRHGRNLAGIINLTGSRGLDVQMIRNAG